MNGIVSGIFGAIFGGYDSPADKEFLRVLKENPTAFYVDRHSIRIADEEYAQKKFEEEAKKILCALKSDQ